MLISSTCKYQQQKASGTIDINISDGTNHCFCCLLATYLSLLQYYMALCGLWHLRMSASLINYKA